MLRRFVALPFVQPFSIDGFQFQVAADSELVLRALARIAEPSAAVSAPSLSWTIQEEQDWPRSMTPANGLSCGPLSLLTFGQHSFLACDRHARRAITFIGASNSGRELEGSLQTMLLHLVREETASTLRVPPGLNLAAGSNVTTS
jgi:hypothetical protein